MRAARAAILLFAGVAACATPGQVRRVETAVAASEGNRARSDSAQRAELARIQIAQRQGLDSISVLVRQLNDNLQRMSRENAGNFDDFRLRLNQVVALSGTLQSSVKGLKSQLETAVSSAPVSGAPADSSRTGGAVQVPQPGALIDLARGAMTAGAFPTARRSLNQLLATYPQAAEVPDAYYWLGNSFDPDQPDSARMYYTKVFTSYPKADRAPSALYKLGALELKLGHLADARRYWQTIVDKYKESTEFPSAQAALRENP